MARMFSFIFFSLSRLTSDDFINILKTSYTCMYVPTFLTPTRLPQAEAVLKVVLTPEESLVPTFVALLSNGTLSDLQKILDLKVSGEALGLYCGDGELKWREREREKMNMYRVCMCCV